MSPHCRHGVERTTPVGQLVELVVSSTGWSERFAVPAGAR